MSRGLGHVFRSFFFWSFGLTVQVGARKNRASG